MHQSLISGAVVSQCPSRPATVISSTVFDLDIVFTTTFLLSFISRTLPRNQGRLLHINNGANAPKVGGTFLQKLRGGSALIINALLL